jgi:hypothetical protein
MTDIYAMQRANGDVFALDDKGRFCVPLFHNIRDAMTARLRNGDLNLWPSMLACSANLDLKAVKIMWTSCW